MSDSERPLEHIMYISLPEEAERNIGEFLVDPDILIPVEIVGGDETWTLRNLSWEMIIAAMLKVIVYDDENPNRGYYRDFVLAAKPDIVDELSATGVEQAERKNFAVAEEIFAALRALAPGDFTPSLNLALVYEEHARIYEQGNRPDLCDSYRDEAFELYNEIIKLFPEEPQVRFNCGHFFLQMKNLPRAREHFRRFLELSEDEKKREIVVSVLEEIEKQTSSDELFREAYDFIRLGKEREGIERILRFLETQPGIWNAWFLLGWAYRRLEEYREARDAFLKAVALGSTETDTLNELAICHMELEEYKEAEKTLRSALRGDPENVKIVSNLAILALKQGKIDESKAFFRTVLEFDPDDAIAKHYLEYLRES